MSQNIKTLKLLEVQIENVKGVKEFKKTLTDNQNLNELFLELPNGAGKSTILDAITYMFIAKNTKNKPLELQNVLEANKMPFISLIIEVDNKKYKLTNQQRLIYQIYDISDINNPLPLCSKNTRAEYSAILQQIIPNIKAFYLFSNVDNFVQLSSLEKNRAIIEAFIQSPFFDVEELKKIYFNKYPQASAQTDKIVNALNYFLHNNANILEARKPLKKQLSKITTNLDFGGFLGSLQPFIEQYIAQKYNNNPQPYFDKKEDRALYFVASKLVEELETQKQAQQDKILSISQKMQVLDDINLCINIYLNDVIKKLGLDFSVKTWTIDSKTQEEKTDFEISKNFIPLEQLNTASQIEINIQICQMLQKFYNLKSFLIIDNAERLDANNRINLGHKFNNLQIIATKVK
ncbi:AAA family ATPase [[Mycoplasma] gypis]|uniref:AAA family ATPase n=1 Tax=[Mycoplasma] gypis TaxID=92404 RepID=A0ABZ2RSJ8_9BACT|nr:AAA family ATPase [[Mycoplasma] gypis]MBN0919455.1 hypothetical protein [[Mycoplasma] gypis]